MNTNDYKANIERVLLGYYIKYDKLFELTNKAFVKRCEFYVVQHKNDFFRKFRPNTDVTIISEIFAIEAEHQPQGVILEAGA